MKLAKPAQSHATFVHWMLEEKGWGLRWVSVLDKLKISLPTNAMFRHNYIELKTCDMFVPGMLILLSKLEKALYRLHYLLGISL